MVEQVATTFSLKAKKRMVVKIYFGGSYILQSVFHVEPWRPLRQNVQSKWCHLRPFFQICRCTTSSDWVQGQNPCGGRGGGEASWSWILFSTLSTNSHKNMHH